MAQWIDGPLIRVDGPNVNGDTVHMVNAFVSYFGMPDGTAPVVGAPFMCRLVVGVDNPPIGSVATFNGVFLPGGVSLVTHAHPACWLIDTSSVQHDVTTDPAADCTLANPAQPNGALALGNRSIPAYQIFEIDFTVVASAPVPGQKITGYVNTQYGELFPEVTLLGLAQPAPAPTQGRIAYRTYPGAPTPFVEAIETMRFDGSDVRRLVSSDQTNDLHVGDPIWSPDAQKLLFDSWRPLPSQTGYSPRNYLMHADGTVQQRLIATGPLASLQCNVPRWSWDGALLVLSAMTTPIWCVWSMQTDGTKQTQHTAGSPGNTAAPGHCLYPVWVGARSIAGIVDHKDIVIFDVSMDGTRDSNAVLFVLDTNWIRSDLVSHPSHDILAFTATSASNFDDEEIHLWDRGAGERSIGKGRYPTFSPDGAWVAYSKQIILPNGSRMHQLFRKDLSGQRETLIAAKWTDYNDWSLI